MFSFFKFVDRSRELIINLIIVKRIVCTDTSSWEVHRRSSWDQYVAMKIDQKCLSLCAEVDCFLSLEVLKKGYATPTDFWNELDKNPETVSRWEATMSLLSMHSTTHDALVNIERPE